LNHKVEIIPVHTRQLALQAQLAILNLHETLQIKNGIKKCGIEYSRGIQKRFQKLRDEKMAFKKIHGRGGNNPLVNTLRVI